MSQWYFQLMGETVGPLTGKELRRRALEGQITSETLVAKNHPSGWVTADRVAGLLDSPNYGEQQQEPKPAEVWFSSPPASGERLLKSDQHATPADDFPTHSLARRAGLWVRTKRKLIIPLGLLFCVIIYATLSGSGSRASNTSTDSIAISQNNPQATQIPKKNYRPELFGAAYAVAQAFYPGQVSVELKDELDKIQNQIQGDKEKDIFNKLTEVMELQTDLQCLEVLKRGGDAAGLEYKQYNLQRMIAKRPKTGLAMEIELEALSKISDADGAPLSVTLVPEMRVAGSRLRSRHPGLQTQVMGGVTWVDYEQTKMTLRELERKQVDEVGNLLR